MSFWFSLREDRKLGSAAATVWPGRVLRVLGALMMTHVSTSMGLLLTPSGKMVGSLLHREKLPWVVGECKLSSSFEVELTFLIRRSFVHNGAVVYSLGFGVYSVDVQNTTCDPSTTCCPWGDVEVCSVFLVVLSEKKRFQA